MNSQPTILNTLKSSISNTRTHKRLHALLIIALSVAITVHVDAQIPTDYIAYYPFNGNANDESGNANDGVVRNGAALTEDRNGNANSAYNFDGFNDYIDITGFTSSSKTYSFSIWVKANDPIDRYSYLFDTQSGRLIFGWQTSTAGKIGFYDGTWNNFENTPNDGEWNHLVIILDDGASQSKLYLNGNQFGPTISYIGKNIGGFVKIGSNYNSTGTSYFKGIVDDVIIYNRVLSESEISDIYNPSVGDGPSLWTQSGTNIYYNSGNVGIGIINPPAKLTVNGAILGTQIKVKTDVSMFPDFVFDPDYPLMTITEVDNYIQTHGHLPDIPTAQEAVSDGHDIGAMNLKLLQKIEELTLYAIEQEGAIRLTQSALRKQEKAYSELHKANSDLKISNDEQKDALRNTQDALRKQEKVYSVLSAAHSDSNLKLLKKIEELTLYFANLNNQYDLLRKENEQQNQEINQLKTHK